MHRILISDPLDASGLEILRASGAFVHELTKEERPRLHDSSVISMPWLSAA